MFLLISVPSLTSGVQFFGRQPAWRVREGCLHASWRYDSTAVHHGFRILERPPTNRNYSPFDQPSPGSTAGPQCFIFSSCTPNGGHGGCFHLKRGSLHYVVTLEAVGCIVYAQRLLPVVRISNVVAPFSLETIARKKARPARASGMTGETSSYPFAKTKNYNPHPHPRVRYLVLRRVVPHTLTNYLRLSLRGSERIHAVTAGRCSNFPIVNLRSSSA